MNLLAAEKITNPFLKPELQDETGASFLSKLISTAITVLLIVGAVTFVFMLLTGAIQWISSGGDKNAVETARNKVTHALIGLIILFAVFAVVQAVELILGINILSIDLTGVGVE